MTKKDINFTKYIKPKLKVKVAEDKGMVRRKESEKIFKRLWADKDVVH